MTEYHFSTTWKLNAPLEKVWQEIHDAHHWPLWWRGVVQANQLQRGDESGVGNVYHFTFRSALPYNLSFQSEVTEVEKHKRIVGRAYGALEGVGTWTFSVQGDNTIVQYNWYVNTTKWWMNMLTPIARPLFTWNHDVIMRWGGQGLAKRLGCELVRVE